MQSPQRGVPNELHRLYTAGDSVSRQAAAVQRLHAITVKHFKDEEAYMEKIGFADLRKHRHSHAQLLARLEGLAAEFRTTGVLTEAFFMFLRMWLKSHVCGIDAQYAKQVHAA